MQRATLVCAASSASFQRPHRRTALRPVIRVLAEFMLRVTELREAWLGAFTASQICEYLQEPRWCLCGCARTIRCALRGGVEQSLQGSARDAYPGRLPKARMLSAVLVVLGCEDQVLLARNSRGSVHSSFHLYKSTVSCCAACTTQCSI